MSCQGHLSHSFSSSFRCFLFSTSVRHSLPCWTYTYNQPHQSCICQHPLFYSLLPRILLTKPQLESIANLKCWMMLEKITTTTKKGSYLPSKLHSLPLNMNIDQEVLYVPIITFYDIFLKYERLRIFPLFHYSPTLVTSLVTEEIRDMTHLNFLPLKYISKT